MKNNKEPEPRDEGVYYQYHDINSVECSTECTGLTPTLPLSEADAASYSEINGRPIKDYRTDKTGRKNKKG